MTKLEIKQSEEFSPLTFELIGRLDTTTAPELEKQIRNIPDTVKELIFNMINLEYISSAGLRILLTVHKLMAGRSGTFLIMNPNESVREVLDITGFTGLLNIKGE